MGSSLIFFVLFNCVLVSLLLWFITFLGSFLYEPKQDQNREVHFECGFFSVNKIVPAYNLNFVVSALFLIIYDIELISLIPAFFNWFLISTDVQLAVCVFIISILFSLLIDVESNSMKWHFNKVVIAQ